MTSRWPLPQPAVRRPPRVLVAGHNLQFFAAHVDDFRAAGAIVREDRWGGHLRHDRERSAALGEWAEIIVCEWCLGNAVWYAERRRPDQRLIVHFHRFELDTPYPADVDIDRVDLVAFSGPHVRDDGLARFGWPASRSVFVPNAVDVDRFDTAKGDDARFTLGLLGYHRRLKRLDLALDILEGLRVAEPRFRLLLKGASPRDFDWVWDDDGERGFFEEQFARITRLGDAVEVEEYGDDVPAWFRRVGFVLSPSDVESFHLAAAEGMASAAVPIFRRRPGVAGLWPDRWVVDDAGEAAERILDIAADGWEAEGRAARDFADRHYALPRIAAAWRSLVLLEPASGGT